MTGSVGAAVVTAAVAVVVGVVAQLETWRRTRSERAYQRRRAALIDVQEAALTLRDALREYGVILPARAASVIGPGAGTEPAGGVVDVVPPAGPLDRARGRVDVCGVRLEPRAASRAAATALDDWRGKADEHFLSPGDLTATAEQQAWQHLNLLIGVALHE